MKNWIGRITILLMLTMSVFSVGAERGKDETGTSDPANDDDFPVRIVRMLRGALGGDQYQQGEEPEDPGCGHYVWHGLDNGEEANVSYYFYQGFHVPSRMLVDLGTIAYPVEPETNTNRFPRSTTLEASCYYFDQSVSNDEHQDFESGLTQQAIWIEAPLSPVEKKYAFLKVTQSVVNVDNWGNPSPEIDRIGIELQRQDRVESVTITTAPNKKYSERYDLTFPVDMIVDPGGGAMQQIDTRLLPVDLDIVQPATGEVAEGSEDSTSAFVEKGKGGLVAIRRNTDTPLTKLVIRALPSLPLFSRFRLKFDSTLTSGKIKIWNDQECTDPVISGQTEFSNVVDRMIYVEGVKEGLGGDLKILQDVKMALQQNLWVNFGSGRSPRV